MWFESERPFLRDEQPGEPRRTNQSACIVSFLFDLPFSFVFLGPLGHACSKIMPKSRIGKEDNINMFWYLPVSGLRVCSNRVRFDGVSL